MSWLQKLLPPKIQRTGPRMRQTVPQGLWTQSVVCAAFEFDFMGGSMGSVVGERFVRGVRVAIEQKLPYVCVTASGGARMQEGLLSLVQMAKTTAALTDLAERRLPFISVLTDPTMGGVSASFAMIGDVRSEEHTSELQSLAYLVCRLLLE